MNTSPATTVSVSLANYLPRFEVPVPTEESYPPFPDPRTASLTGIRLFLASLAKSPVTVLPVVSEEKATSTVSSSGDWTVLFDTVESFDPATLSPREVYVRFGEIRRLLAIALPSLSESLETFYGFFVEPIGEDGTGPFNSEMVPAYSGLRDSLLEAIVSATPSVPTAPAKVETTTKKVSKPRVVEKGGLVPNQVTILRFLASLKPGEKVSRGEIATGADVDEATLCSWLGSANPEIRAKKEASRGYLSLIGLGYVDFVSTGRSTLHWISAKGLDYLGAY